MAEQDQVMRNDFQKGKADWNEEVDSNNTVILKDLIKEIGWPRISQVSKKASKAAWLLVQHSPDREFQRQCLELMKLLPNEEVERKNIAYLEDRVRISQGQKQIYGTQFRKNEVGKFELLPLEDPKNVNTLRKRAGMNTIEEYSEGFKRISNPKQ